MVPYCDPLAIALTAAARHGDQPPSKPPLARGTPGRRGGCPLARDRSGRVQFEHKMLCTTFDAQCGAGGYVACSAEGGRPGQVAVLNAT
jgi:hypothetical protein